MEDGASETANLAARRLFSRLPSYNNLTLNSATKPGQDLLSSQTLKYAADAGHCPQTPRGGEGWCPHGRRLEQIEARRDRLNVQVGEGGMRKAEERRGRGGRGGRGGRDGRLAEKGEQQQVKLGGGGRGEEHGPADPLVGSRSETGGWARGLSLIHI